MTLQTLVGTVLPRYLLIVNLIAFVLFGVDKWRARRKAWRIRERTLFLSALLGGSVGALVGMRFFHHKSKHTSFRVGLPLIFALHLLLAIGGRLLGWY